MEDNDQGGKLPDDHVLLAVEGKIQLLSNSDIQVVVDVAESHMKMVLSVTDLSPSKTKDHKVLQKPRDHFEHPEPFQSTKTVYPSKYLVLPRKGNFDKEREKFNDQAYQSWLKHKIEEEFKRRRESLHATNVTKDHTERKKMNERAFRTWLGKKSIEKVIVKAPTEVVRTRQDSVQRDNSFEMWLEKKEEQKVKQTELEQQRRKEEEERTGQVDPDLARNAYRRWLLQKKNQALEAAATKEKCRRLFFRETQQLTRTLRFQGF